MLASLALVLPSSAATAAVSIESLVTAGQPGPSGGGASYASFTSRPHIDTAGEVVFSSTLSGGQQAVDRWTDGSLTSIAASGDPITGYPSTWSTVEGFSANADGDLVLVGFPDDVTFALVAVHVPRSGAEALLAQAGDVPLPGTAAYVSAGGTSGPAAASAAMLAMLDSDMRGIFVIRAGQDTTVALEDAAGPAGPYGVVGGMSMSSTGGISFADFFNLYLWDGASVSVLGSQGDSIPGLPGESFSSFATVSLSSTGQVAFLTRITTPAGDRAIFTRSPGGTYSMIVRQGDPAPGGGLFSFLNSPRLADSGEVLFLSTLDDGREGIYLHGSDGLRRIVVTGEAAPGTAGGTFSDIRGYGSNESREIVFTASIADGSTTSGVFLASAPRSLPALSSAGSVVAALTMLGGALRVLRRRNRGR